MKLQYGILSFLVFVLLNSTAVASSWVESCNVVLHPNQNTTCGGYSITTPQFSSPIKAHMFNGNLVLDSNVIPAVAFQLNNQTIIVSTESPTYTTDDLLLQVTSDSFTPHDSMLWEYSQYNPQATIHINVREQPSVTLSLSPEHSSYVVRPNTNIVWIVSIQNTGHIDVGNVMLSVPGKTDISLGTLPGNPKNSVNPAKTLNVSTEIPYPNNNSSISLNISAYYDYILITNTQRIILNASSSVILETVQNTPINKSVFLYKTIQPRIYTENTTVTLSLANPSTYYLTDVTIIDRFKPSGINHTWHFDSINSSESKTVSYIVLPSQIGSFTSPNVFASFRINGVQYNVSSASVPVTVVSMNNKVSVSPDEVYVAPISITTPTPKVPAQPTIPIQQTAQPTLAQTPQPQIIVTPTFRIPGFEIIFGIMGLFARYSIFTKKEHK